jgi:hypothetical protein
MGSSACLSSSSPPSPALVPHAAHARSLATRARARLSRQLHAPAPQPARALQRQPQLDATHQAHHGVMHEQLHCCSTDVRFSSATFAFLSPLGSASPTRASYTRS